MTYINAWGDEGTYEEVYDATHNRMEMEDFIHELTYYFSIKEVLEWIYNHHAQEFNDAFCDRIDTALDCWINRYIDEVDRE